MNKKILFAIPVAIAVLSAIYYPTKSDIIEVNTVTESIPAPPAIDNSSSKHEANAEPLIAKNIDMIEALSERLNNVKLASRFVDERGIKNKEEEELKDHYLSLLTHHDIDINNQIPLGDSIFKNTSRMRWTHDGQKEVLYKLVFKYPISSDELYGIMKYNDLEEFKHIFSLTLPYMDFDGELKIITAEGCMNGGHKRYICPYDNSFIRFYSIDEDGIALEVPEYEMKNIPATTYILKNNDLFMYNHLDENFEIPRHIPKNLD